MANCVRNTIDSNATGLYFAETDCGVLPDNPVWYELEPNSYSSFGGTLTTTARAPIKRNRQRQKGTLTGLDAEAGFNQDWTQNNFDRLLQGFMFANWHEKPNTRPMNDDALPITGVSASGDLFNVAGGGLLAAGFVPGMLVKASGFGEPGNNGVFTVASVADNGLGVTGDLVDETPPAGATLEAIGFGFGSGGTALTVSGGLASLVITGSAPATASGTLTVEASENADPDDTLIVGTTSYVFVDGLPTEPGDIPIGADDDETAANVAAAINGDVLHTPAHPSVTASVTDNVVTITARHAGVTGNNIELATNGDHLTVSGATLTGGTGLTFTGLGLIPGEWVYLGGDAASAHFEDNRGYARIGRVLPEAIRFDKTTWVPTADAGTGVSLSLYLGNYIRNEPDPDDIVAHYYEFERTLGRDANGPQAEYVTAAVANELTLAVPTEDKVAADISFVAGDKRTRNGLQGLKPGTRLAALGQDAYNTSTDVYRIRVALVDETNSAPGAFFGFLSEYELAIVNNVSGVKGIGKLGNIDVSVGTFDVGGELTGYFTSVAASEAIRNNASVTVDAIFARENQGLIWDIPLLTLTGGEIEVSENEPVTIPCEQMGAENPNGYTLLYMSFPYLPNAAMPVLED